MAYIHIAYSWYARGKPFLEQKKLPSNYFSGSVQFDLTSHLPRPELFETMTDSKYLFPFLNVPCDNFNTFCRKKRALAIEQVVSLLVMIHIPGINKVNTV